MVVKLKKIPEKHEERLISRRSRFFSAASRRVWLIMVTFLFVLVAAVIGAVIFIRNNTSESKSLSFASQPLSAESLSSLKASVLAPEDYLLGGRLTVGGVLKVNTIAQSAATNAAIAIPNATGVLAVSATGALVLDSNGNLSCPSCVLKTDRTTASSVTNNTYSTTELVTNNAYYTTELVTNNYISNIINTISLTAGDGIVITGTDGNYVVSATGGADKSLSNLSGVALNTSLTPASNNQIDIGSASSMFRNGYYGGGAYSSLFDTNTNTTLSIGTTMSSDIALGSNTALATGKTFTTSGDVLFKVNSATAFQVQRTSGTSVFSVDTSTARVGIGSASPSNKLSVNNLTTADAATQIAISTGAAINKGIVIQGTVGQSADLFQVQSSTGAVVASIGATGTISTAGNLVVAGNTTASGSFVGTGSVLFKNITNSTTAFQVQDSAGIATLTANTTQGVLSVGNFVPTTLWLKPPVTIDTKSVAVNSNLRDTAVADFNSDGLMDFATIGYMSNQIYIYINTGGGVFASPIIYSTLCSSTELKSADFNKDGKPDLVYACGLGIQVMMNNGSGGFLPTVTSVTTVGRNLIVADLNGDSWPDIASSGSYGVFYANLNNKNGTFANAITSNIPSASPIRQMVGGDFNGDGIYDLAVSNYLNQTVDVLSGTGTGSFVLRASYPVGFAPSPIGVADINGDGKLDIVVGEEGGTRIATLLNTGTGFGAAVAYKGSALPYSISFGDFSHDGRPDIVVSERDARQLEVYISNSDGTLSLSNTYATNSSGLGPHYIATGDFNNDGVADVVSNDSQNTIYIVKMTAFGSIQSQAPDSRILINVGANKVGQIIQGTPGQTADYLKVIDNYENSLFSINATGGITASSTLTVGSDITSAGKFTVAGAATVSGNALFRTSVNSSAAVQVQQADGTTVFGVDTSYGRIGIGTATPYNSLTINNLTTYDLLSQVAIGTLAATNKGLVVQGVANQSADLIQAQSSAGAVLASISSVGKLTVTSASITGTLMLGGHVITSGVAPTFIAGVAACASPIILVSGNDTSGTVTITTGTGCSVAGVLATLTLNSAFVTAPRIMITPSNANATGLGLYSGASTTGTFTVDAATAPTNSTVYKLNYWAVQ